MQRRPDPVHALFAMAAHREHRHPRLDEQAAHVLSRLAARNVGAVVEHEVAAIPQIIVTLATQRGPHWIEMTLAQAADLISGSSGLSASALRSDWR